MQLGDRSSLFLSLLLKTCKVPTNAPMFYAITTRSTILSSCLPHITGIAASPRAIFCHNAGGEQGLKAFKLGGGYHYTIFLLVILTLWFVTIWNSSRTILRFSMTDDFPHQASRSHHQDSIRVRVTVATSCSKSSSSGWCVHIPDGLVRLDNAVTNNTLISLRNSSSESGLRAPVR